MVELPPREMLEAKLHKAIRMARGQMEIGSEARWGWPGPCGLPSCRHPIAIVGTSTAALNIFPFAGGAILQQLSGLMLASRSLEAYQGLWLFMLICMVMATAAAFLSQEKEPGKGQDHE